MFVFIYRESAGALHYGYEPLVLVGAGVPDAVSAHVFALGHPAPRPETSHLPQQELPGSPAGPRLPTEGQTQSLHPALNKQTNEHHVVSMVTGH